MNIFSTKSRCWGNAVVFANLKKTTTESNFNKSVNITFIAAVGNRWDAFTSLRTFEAWLTSRICQKSCFTNLPSKHESKNDEDDTDMKKFPFFRLVKSFWWNLMSAVGCVRIFQLGAKDNFRRLLCLENLVFFIENNNAGPSLVQVSLLRRKYNYHRSQR